MAKVQKPARRNRSSSEDEAYQGLLAEPHPRPHSLSTEEEIYRWATERAVKTMHLFSHHSVDPTAEDAWCKLAFALAEEHVPGFKPPPNKRGRRRGRNNDDINLVLLVDLLKRRDQIGQKAACKIIAEAGVMTGKDTTLLERYKWLKRKESPFRVFFEVMERLANLMDRHAGDGQYVKGLDEDIGHLLRRD
jgi:hypothetical protein